jgi:hypothetical protein
MIKKFNIFLILILICNFNRVNSFEVNTIGKCTWADFQANKSISNEIMKDLAFNASYSLINTNLNKIFIKESCKPDLIKKIPIFMLVYIALALGLYDTNFDANLIVLSFSFAALDNLMLQRYLKGSFVSMVENKFKNLIGLKNSFELQYKKDQIANLCSDLSWGSALFLIKKAAGY